MSTTKKGSHVGYRRRRQPDVVIPESSHDYDLWGMLNHAGAVDIRTVDGLTIKVQKTASTAIDFGAGRIENAQLTVEYLGEKKVYERATCEQHCSSWKTINPGRIGQYWWFVVHCTSASGVSFSNHGSVQVACAM